MNPIVAGLAADVMRWDVERKLIRLRDQLVAIGINAELRDNNSALMVQRPDPGLPVSVFVQDRGAFYSWQDATERHPANDPRGAATALAEYIQGR